MILLGYYPTISFWRPCVIQSTVIAAEVEKKAIRWPCGSVVEVLIVIQYSVLAVKCGYTRTAVV